MAMFYFWFILNCVALTLVFISNNRRDYLASILVYFYSKNILDFILKVLILFAYLPFTIASLIKEIFNE